MRHSKKLAALAIAAGVAITASAALAYWTTNGSGSGSASAAADYSNRISVHQHVMASGLVPGGVDQVISGDFGNSNPGDVRIVSLTADIKNLDGTPWSVKGDDKKPACTKDDFSLSVEVTDDLVAANQAHDGAWTGLISMVNGAENQDNCKGLTPPIQFATQ